MNIKVCLAALVALGVAATSRAAEAVEGQWHLGGSAAFLGFTNPERGLFAGVAGNVNAAYGVTDAINLLAQVDVGVIPSSRVTTSPTADHVLFGGSLGAAYVFDVVSIVPYGGVSIGMYGAAGSGGVTPLLGLGIPFGLSYVAARTFQIGIAGEYKLMLLDPRGPAQWITVGPRVELTWD